MRNKFAEQVVPGLSSRGAFCARNDDLGVMEPVTDGAQASSMEVALAQISTSPGPPPRRTVKPGRVGRTDVFRPAICPESLDPFVNDLGPRPAGWSIAPIAQMQKLDIAALEAAFEGTPVGSR
jgi:hypothetical protein